MPEPEVPGSVCRPKSLCVPKSAYYESENIYDELPNDDFRYSEHQRDGGDFKVARTVKKCSCGISCDSSCARRLRRGRRNPVHRAASRLYSAGKAVRIFYVNFLMLSAASST